MCNNLVKGLENGEGKAGCSWRLCHWKNKVWLFCLFIHINTKIKKPFDCIL